MRIDSYSFGHLTAGGRSYTSDVIIYPDRIEESWWREEGHFLQVKDLSAAFAAQPDVLIIGTGYAGVMSVPEGVKNHIRSLGIELHVERTGKAVELYNKLRESSIVVAALHLTC